MSGPVWRAILLVERFLPKPRLVVAGAERASKAQRQAAWLPFIAILPAVLPMLVRQRHELGAIAAQNRIAFEQIALVVTGCVIVATIVAAGLFGARAWRDAKGGR